MNKLKIPIPKRVVVLNESDIKGLAGSHFRSAGIKVVKNRLVIDNRPKQE